MYITEIWTGWWDEQKEGEWVSILDSSKLLRHQSFTPYKQGEPNGLTMENCGRLRIHRDEGVWEDVNCAEPFERSCVACQISSTPIFVLRGMLYNDFIFSIKMSLFFKLNVSDHSKMEMNNFSKMIHI